MLSEINGLLQRYPSELVSCRLIKRVSTKKLGLLEQHLLIEAYFNGMVAYP